MAFDKDNGGIRRAVAGGRFVFLDTPTLHLLPTDAGTGEEPFLWSWFPTDFSAWPATEKISW